MKPKLIILCTVLLFTTTQAAKRNRAVQPHGIDVTNMNLKVKPGNDFYRYATGRWSIKNPMPADKSRYIVFNVLSDSNDARIKGLIEEMSRKNAADGTPEQKIGTLYNKVLDSKTLNAQGIEPLLKYTHGLDAISSREQLQTAMAWMARSGVNSFFNFGADADAKNSKMNIVTIIQGGLTLSSRDYYLDTDTATLKIRNAYREFGRNVFAKIYPEASAAEIAQKMGDVLRIETALAQSFKSRTQLRVPENNYFKMSRASLNREYPAIMWDKFFEINCYKGFDDVNVGQPEALEEANRLLTNEPLNALKNYLTFRVGVTALDYLSDDLRKLSFDFFGKTMSGIEQEEPAWKRAVSLDNELLGEAIGRIYTARYFPESAKQRMLALVNNLQTALGERIKAQGWMSDKTKQKALEKLGAFYIKVGYPNTWRDYSALSVNNDASLLDIIVQIQRFNNDYYADKLVGKPVDRDQWLMTPQTVNAYYNPPTNEICFPAGILQYPFFDPNADDAFNYGAIGVVIGHEMTHGFDDQGRKYDKDGNMKEWWSTEDSKKFNERTQVMADFYNNIKVLPDLHADGQMTLGENLADHGGLQVAYAALQHALKGKEAKTSSSFTPEQQFFIAFAGVWAGSIRTPEIRKRVKIDPHSLAEWRVNGQMPHIDAWYKAFNVRPGDKLYIPKEKRVTIW